MARQSIPDRERIVAFAEATVLGAGALVARARESGTVSMRYKRDIELVTSADDASDQFIRREIQSHFPSDAILSEESGTTGKDSLTEGGLWIVDPIDGTVNFAHGQSQVAVSVAYAHDGEVLAGAVAAPFQEEVFTAAKGRGARRNGSRIKVSGAQDLRRALIATGFPHDRRSIEPVIHRLTRVVQHCQDVRRAGSPVLDMCWVADGRLDGYYETVFPWDVAAARLIATEAGAMTDHLDGVPSGVPGDLCGEGIVVATPGIFRALIELLRSV